LFRDYANQNLQWGKAGTPNEYNELTYEVTTIRGRKEEGFKLITDDKGQQVVSTGKVMTEANVSARDTIDGRGVISVIPAIGLEGFGLWNEVYLR